ncbi:MAG TPA: ferritin-like domain-containing protein [Acidimicrobiia bacterium]
MSVYTMPTDGSWEIESPAITSFDWSYDEGRDQLLRLYDKGTRQQWRAKDRLDWSIDVDPANPMGVGDEYVPIFGSPVWDKLTEKGRARVRHHMVAWQFSQFMHGEQGALICTAKIVQTVPDIDAKYYAATQVIDEARHVEVYSRYLYEKLQLAYPVNGNLQSLLDDAISDRRWDMTYLAMQVLIEGLALAAFGLIRNQAQEPLAKALNAYVMQDEARHVAFGRLALRDYYPRLSDAERDEREEFCVDACYRMRDRFLGEEVWETLELPVDELLDYVRNSETQQLFRSYLFARIVPTLKDIGLWGPRIRKAFADMDVLDFADSDLEAIMAEDERTAVQIDADRLRPA